MPWNICNNKKKKKRVYDVSNLLHIWTSRKLFNIIRNSKWIYFLNLNSLQEHTKDSSEFVYNWIIIYVYYLLFCYHHTCFFGDLLLYASFRRLNVVHFGFITKLVWYKPSSPYCIGEHSLLICGHYMRVCCNYDPDVGFLADS